MPSFSCLYNHLLNIIIEQTASILGYSIVTSHIVYIYKVTGFVFAPYYLQNMNCTSLMNLEFLCEKLPVRKWCILAMNLVGNKIFSSGGC